jgi:hypothetical protein
MRQSTFKILVITIITVMITRTMIFEPDALMLDYIF